jgi:hypothetical protein
MAGGLMQLVAYGAQDVYLTGQPKVTFFQAVYKRHTNFAMENIQQTLNGTASSGGRVSVTIARNGDLVGNMYVRLQPNVTNGSNTGIVVPTSTNLIADVNWIAERAIADVELTIGGQRIDKHYQVWWRLYSELFLCDEDKIIWGKMAGCSSSPLNTTTGGSAPSVFLPLLFFFNRNPGLYLPLIALQYHEVRLDFNLTSYFGTFFASSTFEVWANYVYLDTEERRRFAQKGHEYLIEQLQHTGADSVTVGNTNTIRLSYNHPVKELIWCYTNPNYPGTITNTSTGVGTNLNSMWNFSSNCANVNVTSNLASFVTSNNYVIPHHIGTPHIYTNGALPASNVFWTEDFLPQAGINEVGPLDSFKLILNGQDRFAAQSGKYFNQVQPFYYHSGNPYPGIYAYSFGLQPEEHQPTGTCNFSRIDNAQVTPVIKVGSTTTQQRMFAVNYNILRIQSGMGGLAFSN